MKVCAVVPAFKVVDQINKVVDGLLPYVNHVFVIDDCCPHDSGNLVSEIHGDNPQVSIITLKENLGVGGAVITGYMAAQEAAYDIVIKVDGDDQMDPKHIPNLIAPIAAGEADYTKGNRFFDPSYLDGMPITRIIGNTGLSFMSKASTGHWHIMDPTNGFTAIHTRILPWLHLEKVQQRYFFETDMLYRLGTIDAIVQDIPMPSIYGDEESNLSVGKTLFEFSAKHTSLVFKRVFYTYFLRNFNLASVFLLCSIPLLLLSTGFGVSKWIDSIGSGQAATAGTIMLAALPFIVGLQLLFGFLSYDMNKRPSRPLWLKLGAVSGNSQHQKKQP